MSQRSLRARLTLNSAAVIFIAVVILVIGTTWHVWREQVESLDLSLKREAKVTVRLLTKSATLGQAKALIEIESSAELDERTLRIWDRSGKLIFQTGDHRILDLLPERVELMEFPRFANVTANDHRLRLGRFQINEYEVEVAADLARIEDTIADLLPVYSVVLPLLVILTLWGGFWLAGRALRPIGELAHEAENITAEQLDRPLLVTAADDEIGRLSKVLNAMLDRLRVSFAQSRRFSADASHELKTPLTILRAQLESTLYSQKTPEAWQASLVASLEEVDRISRIIDGLLLLALSDSGQFDLRLEPMNFSRFIDGLIEDAELLAAPHDLKLQVEIDPDLWVMGNDLQLRQVVLNLFDNACKYNRPHGQLKVQLTTEDEKAVLRVANTGEEISSAQAEKLFERFYRGDAAHGRKVDGLGLGLAIAREITHAHSGDLGFVSREAGWNTFALTLPRVPTPPIE